MRQLTLNVKILQFSDIEQSGCLAAISFTGNQGSAIGTHQARNIWPDDFPPSDLFKAAQNGIVEERTTLDDNLLAELRGISELANQKLIFSAKLTFLFI